MADLTNISLVRNAAVEISVEEGAASQTLPLSGYPDDIFLYVRNVDAAAATITIVAPTDGNRAAWGADLGDISQAVAQNEEFILGPFDGYRFKDASEDITVTVTDADGSAYSGTVTNVKLAMIKQAK